MKHVAMGTILAFFSYSHKDKAHLADLKAALAPLREEGVIDGWDDNAIMPSERWDDTIKRSLERAHVLLYVVTPSLLTSRYVNEVEIPVSIARAAQDKCVIVPVLTERPDDLELWHANQLGGYQPVPELDRWISDYDSSASAYDRVRLGVREACTRVGGGDNPLRRAEVGDWRHALRRSEFPNGQLAEWEFTEEVVEKADGQAVVLVQTTMTGALREFRIEYDLTKSIQAQDKSISDQAGLDLSAMASMSTRAAAGEAEIRREFLSIGQKQYETRVQSVTSHSEMNGLTMQTDATAWQSIDVPFGGAVKMLQSISWPNGMSTSNTWKLLDYGYADAAARKPAPASRTPIPPELAATMGIQGAGADASPGRLSEGQHVNPATASDDPFAKLKGLFNEFVAGFKEGSAQQQSSQWQMPPGRWGLQANDMNGSLSYDLMLQPNYQLQGMCWHNGLQSQLQGSWGFDPMSGTLRLDVTATAPGYPPNAFWVTFRITGSDHSAYHVVDPNQRPFRLWRMG